MTGHPSLSIVVPVYNEEQNVPLLVDAVRTTLAQHPAWELILVDDGSRDRTVERAEELAGDDERIRVLRLAKNYGQTQAMQAGFDAARGAVVVSMDGDLQNDPADIPRLVDTLEQGYDLVAGYRERRQDKLLTRKVPSWIANRLIRAMTGVPIRDNGCSLKAYRRELLDQVHLYSDMHRFIPAVASATAGAGVAEIPVRHHARRFGRSKYGLSRVVKVLADLLTIKMIGSFRERPLAMFAAGAALSLFMGLFSAAMSFLAYVRFQPEKAAALVMPSVALLWFGLACYLMMLGLIAEVAVREHSEVESGHLPVVREWGLEGRGSRAWPLPAG